MNQTPARVRSRTRKRKGQGTVTKSVEKKQGSQTVDSAESVERFNASDCPNPAYVGTKIGFTKNLGNFESIRVDVSLSVPTEPDESSMRRAFDKVAEMGEDLIALEIQNAEDIKDA